jgi:hypothetical protein
MKTHTLGPASANIVWQAIAVMWVTHEDGGFDGCQSISGECSSRTATESVVHDLTTLIQLVPIIQPV